MCSPSAPPAPDYAGAAQATATGNLEAAKAAAAANRVNQITPYGSLTYNESGKDSSGNPMWTATQSLSPAQQQLLDQQNKTSLGLSSLADQGLGYVKNALGNQLTMANLPKSMVNAGQTGQDALMARFQPQIDQSHAALENQLANQGIMRGSEAYNNAMRTQNESENDLRSQAALNGINVGQNAQNQQFQLLSQLQNQPLNMLNAVRTGSQVSNPSFVNAPQQATTQGADMLGAANGQNQYNMGLYNSKVAQNNSLLGAGANLAGMAMFSDVRLKTNIERIGTHDKLGIGIYSYEKFGRPEIGVLAQELEQVKPEAVHTHESGYKMIDIGAL
jgi:hypothetical protein